MANRFKIETVFKAVDQFVAPVAKMQNRVGKFTRSIERGLRRINRRMDAFSSKMAAGTKAVVSFATIGIGAVSIAAGALLREFSKIENAQAAFTPLLGGADRARKMVDALNKTAATTPFQFENLAKTASFLLPVMNGDIQETIRNIRMLGDTAGGNAQKLESITRGFTKAMLKGKPDMEAMNMIAEAGVPIFSEMAASMGIAKEELFELSKQGKLTTTDLEKAFIRMTSEGGIFFRGMQIASETLSGRISTLKDNISLTAAEFGKSLAPTAKKVVDRLIDAAAAAKAWAIANEALINRKVTEFIGMTAEALKKLGKVLGFILKHRDTIFKVGATIAILIGTLKALVAIMTLVNIVMTANPIGLVIVAVGALIAIIAGAIIWWDKLKAAFSSLNPVVRTFLSAIGRMLRQFTMPFEVALRTILKIKDTIASLPAVKQFFDDEEPSTGQRAAMVSPQERIARSISESRTTSEAEITLKADTGTSAELTSGSLGDGLTLIPTGAL